MKIPKDKMQHFLVGLLATLFFGIIFMSDGESISAYPQRGIIVGVLVGVLLGAGKEFIWDRWMKKGQFDLVDMWATFLGTGVGATILLIFTLI